MTSILITGASKGIGRATATELARRGHRVVATARDPSTLDDLGVAERLRLDVTDQASVDAAVAAAGEVDVLVSNAGNIFYAAVEASPPDELERLFAQNTVGAMRVAQAVLPQMRERGAGRLLFVSSIAGRVVLPGGVAYAATKWALEAFAEGLAIEAGHFGVEVGLLQPGAVASGALDDVLKYDLPGDPYAGLFAQREMAVGSMLGTDEVAAAIADAVEREVLPLRIPVGAGAEAVLARRRSEPDDVPFLTAPLDW